MATDRWILTLVTSDKRVLPRQSVAPEKNIGEWQTELANSAHLQGPGSSQLVLWKLDHATYFDQLAEYIASGKSISKIATKMVTDQPLSFFFSKKPTADRVYIVVGTDSSEGPILSDPHQASEGPTLSDPNKASEDPVISSALEMLQLLHKHLWNQTQLKDQVIRTASLSAADYLAYIEQTQKFRKSSLKWKSAQIFLFQSQFLGSRCIAGDRVSTGENKRRADDVVNDHNDSAQHDSGGDGHDTADNQGYGTENVNATHDHGDMNISEDADINEDTGPLKPDHEDRGAEGVDATDEDEDMDEDEVVDENEDMDESEDTDEGTNPLRPDVLCSMLPIPLAVADGLVSVLPRRVRYVDLVNPLGPSIDVRVPLLIFIPDAWDALTKEMETSATTDVSGRFGSAILTGQPGIGKTCYLYYRLVQRILNGRRTLFQDFEGTVYLIAEEGVVALNNPPNIKEPTLALVDAEGSHCRPSWLLLKNWHLRILVVSSPRPKDDRKWVYQHTQSTRREFIMDGWVWEDLVVCLIFMGGQDIDLKRLQLSVAVCGLVPRHCKEAAPSEKDLNIKKELIKKAITSMSLSDLSAALYTSEDAKPASHRVFHMHPGSSRKLVNVVLRPVSKWAVHALDAALMRSNREDAHKLYNMIQGVRPAASLRGSMWERRVHAFFWSLSSPRQFQIISLDNRERSLTITFPPQQYCRTFGPAQSFTGYLKSAMENEESSYLVPLSPTFPGFDSFLYQNDFQEDGFRPFIGLQITNAASHPISLTGLQDVQKALKEQWFSDLRPSSSEKWILVFVVPQHMVASFGKQKLEPKPPSRVWHQKVSQYVLALGDEVWEAAALPDPSDH